MKRLMTGLLAISLLAACGGGDNSTQVTPPTSSGGSGASGSTNRAPIISGAPNMAVEGVAFTFTPTASDPDGDALTFSVANKPNWADFSTSTGALTGVPSYVDIANIAETTIMVSDGNLDASLAVTVQITQDVLEKAIRTGDASGITNKADVINGLTQHLAANKQAFSEAKAKLFGLSPTGELTADSLTNLTWNPTHDAARLTASFGFNEAVLISNDVTDPSYDVTASTLGIVGETGEARRLNETCQSYPEYFLTGTAPQASKAGNKPSAISLRQPTPGLHIAYDPRLPKKDQAFEFQLAGLMPTDSVEWHVGGKTINTQGSRLEWPIEKGEHEVTAIIRRGGKQIQSITPTQFLVK